MLLKKIRCFVLLLIIVFSHIIILCFASLFCLFKMINSILYKTSIKIDKGRIKPPQSTMNSSWPFKSWYYDILSIHAIKCYICYKIILSNAEFNSYLKNQHLKMNVLVVSCGKMHFYLREKTPRLTHDDHL